MYANILNAIKDGKNIKYKKTSSPIFTFFPLKLMPLCVTNFEILNRMIVPGKTKKGSHSLNTFTLRFLETMFLWKQGIPHIAILKKARM